MAGIYKYTLVRRAATYSIIIIYQVKVVRCETAHSVHVTERETATVKDNTQQSSSSGSSTMYAYKTDFSIF